MRRIRIPVVLVLLALLALVPLVFPVAAGATPPLKGARYSGTITVQRFTQGPVEFALAFTVDPSGREVRSFSFPNAAPFGIDCQMGPLGEPASSGRHAAIEGGTFGITFPLEFLFEGAEKSGQPDLGNVRLEGGFRPHGVFVGTLDNRTPMKPCRGGWTFKLHAQSR